MSKVRRECFIKGVTGIFRIVQVNFYICHDPMKLTFLSRRIGTAMSCDCRVPSKYGSRFIRNYSFLPSYICFYYFNCLPFLHQHCIGNFVCGVSYLIRIFWELTVLQPSSDSFSSYWQILHFCRFQITCYRISIEIKMLRIRTQISKRKSHKNHQNNSNKLCEDGRRADYRQVCYIQYTSENGHW